MKKGLTIATTKITLFTQLPSSSKAATSSTAKKATKAETGMDSYGRYKYGFFG